MVRVWSTELAVVISLFTSFDKNKYYSCLYYKNGSISCISAIHGIFIGNHLRTLNYFYTSKICLKLGFRVLLFFLKKETIFSDLSINNKLYIAANGVYGKIQSISFDLNLGVIKLPSGKKSIVSLSSFVTLGRKSNIFAKYIVYGNAGSTQNIGFKSIVRGVAMNPVDHPHGGRTKTNQPEVSP